MSSGNLVGRLRKCRSGLSSEKTAYLLAAIARGTPWPRRPSCPHPPRSLGRQLGRQRHRPRRTAQPPWPTGTPASSLADTFCARSGWGHRGGRSCRPRGKQPGRCRSSSKWCRPRSPRSSRRFRPTKMCRSSWAMMSWAEGGENHPWAGKVRNKKVNWSQKEKELNILRQN